MGDGDNGNLYGSQTHGGGAYGAQPYGMDGAVGSRTDDGNTVFDEDYMVSLLDRTGGIGVSDNVTMWSYMNSLRENDDTAPDGERSERPASADTVDIEARMKPESPQTDHTVGGDTPEYVGSHMESPYDGGRGKSFVRTVAEWVGKLSASAKGKVADARSRITGDGAGGATGRSLRIGVRVAACIAVVTALCLASYSCGYRQGYDDGGVEITDDGSPAFGVDALNDEGASVHEPAAEAGGASETDAPEPESPDTETDGTAFDGMSDAEGDAGDTSDDDDGQSDGTAAVELTDDGMSVEWNGVGGDIGEDGLYHVTGVLTNGNDYPVDAIVSYDLFDWYSQPVSVAEARLDDLQPGESRGFDAVSGFLDVAVCMFSHVDLVY